MINPVNHAQIAGRRSRPTRSSRTWWPPTSTRSRRTPAAAAGPGTPARPAGCTGSIVESLLGLRLEVDKLRLAPCLPPHWPGFTLRYRYRETVYHIAVVRDESGSVEHVIDLVDDRREHLVEIKVGGVR